MFQLRLINIFSLIHFCGVCFCVCLLPHFFDSPNLSVSKMLTLSRHLTVSLSLCLSVSQSLSLSVSLSLCLSVSLSLCLSVSLSLCLSLHFLCLSLYFLCLSFSLSLKVFVINFNWKPRVFAVNGFFRLSILNYATVLELSVQINFFQSVFWYKLN